VNGRQLRHANDLQHLAQKRLTDPAKD